MPPGTAPAFAPPWAPATDAVWPESGRFFCLALTTVVSAAWVARHKAVTVLEEWGVSGEHADTARLLISELVTNAVMFGKLPGVPVPGQITLALWHLRDALVIEVADQSADLPVLRPAGGAAERGRGLHLVAALSSQWGHYAAYPGWKTVYCVLDVAATTEKVGRR
jgi:anti-sigma regulatory factor (Ser/Thr protein kinase)